MNESTPPPPIDNDVVAIPRRDPPQRTLSLAIWASINAVRNVLSHKATAVFLNPLIHPRQLSSGLLAVVAIAAAYSAKSPAIQGTMASICASFVFVYVTNVQQEWRFRREASRFRAFFGQQRFQDTVHLVYSDFVLGEDARSALHAINPQFVFQKKNNRFHWEHRVDISSIVADNDLRALVYVAGLFGRMCHDAPPVCVDTKVVEEPDMSFVSFGLSSNDCTHMYLRRTGQQALFRIVKDLEGGEHIVVRELETDHEFRSDGDSFIGVIVRHRPEPLDHPDRVWFICAGLGERGTTGAAWYLANRWQKLWEKAKDRDFVAVIQVANYSDKEAHEVLFVTNGGPDVL